VYRIVPDEAVIEQLAALPPEALAAYADLVDVLRLAPWNGEPQHEDNPGGAVRRWHFGLDQAGQLIYLIDEHERAVHLTPRAVDRLRNQNRTDRGWVHRWARRRSMRRTMTATASIVAVIVGVAAHVSSQNAIASSSTPTKPPSVEVHVEGAHQLSSLVGDADRGTSTPIRLHPQFVSADAGVAPASFRTLSLSRRLPGQQDGSALPTPLPHPITTQPRR
jgi:hypothetical protein